MSAAQSKITLRYKDSGSEQNTRRISVQSKTTLTFIVSDFIIGLIIIDLHSTLGVSYNFFITQNQTFKIRLI